MRRSLALTCAVTAAICIAGSAADSSVPLNLISQLAVAPNGRATAVAAGASDEMIWLIRGRVVREVRLPKQHHVSLLLWSADSRFVAAEIQEGDERTSVALIDTAAQAPAATPVAKGATTFFAPHWSASGHDLFLVPNYPTDALPTTPGLYELDAATAKMRVLGSDRLFVGEYSVNDTSVVARVVRRAKSGPVYELVHIDLRTGAIRFLIE